MKTTKIYFSFSTILILAALILTSCSSISVNQDYDPAYDFSKLKTYGFIPITEEAGIDQLNATRLGDAIKENLNAKGYTLSENADFGIALFFTKDTKTSIQSSGGYGYGYGYGYRGYGGMGGSTYVSQYDEGTLVIDFVDMAKQELVWRGVGTGVLDETPTVEERTANINYAVAEILAQFPPTKAEE
ncbi:MAG: DUF4136 domain-containing protein [Ignavibacteriaceae bacterium]|nr:DUF4136 domain-containing protein [Ignavibacteriaceae bacterium]